MIKVFSSIRWGSNKFVFMNVTNEWTGTKIDYIYIYIYIYIYPYTKENIIYIYIYIYTHTHTHTQTYMQKKAI